MLPFSFREKPIMENYLDACIICVQTVQKDMENLAKEVGEIKLLRCYLTKLLPLFMGSLPETTITFHFLHLSMPK